jgi:hypothetical protein
LGAAAALKRPAWQGERESATPVSSPSFCMAERKGTLDFLQKGHAKGDKLDSQYIYTEKYVVNNAI